MEKELENPSGEGASRVFPDNAARFAQPHAVLPNNGGSGQGTRWLWGHLMMKIPWFWRRIPIARDGHGTGIPGKRTPLLFCASSFSAQPFPGKQKALLASRALVGTKSCYLSEANGIQGPERKKEKNTEKKREKKREKHREKYRFWQCNSCCNCPATAPSANTACSAESSKEWKIIQELQTRGQ